MILYLPFIIQGLIMMVDEFYFHEKRGLPKWEIIGHPLDSLSVLFCYAYLAFVNPTQTALTVYICLCVFSCLFITKDEWVHKEQCEPLENWLHSLLFILHPITFAAAGVLWFEGEHTFLVIQPVIILVFMSYQIIRWSRPWHPQK